jgi:Ras-related protein Rab-8A
VSKILVGHKCDQVDNKVVSTKEGRRLAREFNIQFYECSSLTNENIQTAVESLVKAIQERLEEERVTKSEEIGPGFFEKIAIGWNSWRSTTSSME